MTKKKVVILGASGMLGSMVAEWFSRQAAFDTVATVRTRPWRRSGGGACHRSSGGCWMRSPSRPGHRRRPWRRRLGGQRDRRDQALHPRRQRRGGRAGRLRERAVSAPSGPGRRGHGLPRAADRDGLRLLRRERRVRRGGQARRAGCVRQDQESREAWSGSVFHLRASIIGPEPKAHVSLLDWFLGQKKDAAVNGFTNHQWNGVTTLHFARLCHGIITHEFGRCRTCSMRSRPEASPRRNCSSVSPGVRRGTCGFRRSRPRR